MCGRGAGPLRGWAGRLFGPPPLLGGSGQYVDAARPARPQRDLPRKHARAGPVVCGTAGGLLSPGGAQALSESPRAGRQSPSRFCVPVPGAAGPGSAEARRGSAGRCKARPCRPSPSIEQTDLGAAGDDALLRREGERRLRVRRHRQLKRHSRPPRLLPRGQGAVVLQKRSAGPAIKIIPTTFVWRK